MVIFGKKKKKTRLIFYRKLYTYLTILCSYNWAMHVDRVEIYYMILTCVLSNVRKLLKVLRILSTRSLK